MTDQDDDRHEGDDARASGDHDRESGKDRDDRPAGKPDDDDDRDGKDHDGDHEDDEGDKDSDKGERKRPGKKPLIILAVVVLILIVVALVWWLMTRNQESTDDAYTDGNAVTIAPKVSGYVAKLFINDNVYVHKGDLMLVIDKRDYQAQVDQARAQLGLAKAQLDAAQVQFDIAKVQYPAQYQQAHAQIESAEASLKEARAAYERQHAVDERATSRQNVDTADAQYRTANANVDQARAQLQTASLVPQQIRQAAAVVEERLQQVNQADAQLEQAELNLSWCDVRAPSDGWVTRRNVQLGSFLQAGATLFSLVTPQVWITANFKESQLDEMRSGDKVEIGVDAYPSLELHGHVDSVQLGSGSRFSAFPAENATGNFVKIVQRVPVKIVIDSGMPKDHPLGLGLSVSPTVYLK